MGQGTVSLGNDKERTIRWVIETLIVRQVQGFPFSFGCSGYLKSGSERTDRTQCYYSNSPKPQRNRVLLIVFSTLL